ncbi:hypothetical protein AAFC00_007210 [Neodothiora populina]|uniref:Uncharacterized protein n=1 Tax=Neodothiora populina TaxID=2781224 RepID=A0ABR3PHJ0_9PEZI
MKSRISLLCLTLALISVFAVNPVSCATPPSFCKCTCYSNSTIIPLNDPVSSASAPLQQRLFSALWTTTKAPPRSADDGNTKDNDGEKHKSGGNKKKQRTCADCNRQFCLDYNLPICAGIKALSASSSASTKPGRGAASGSASSVSAADDRIEDVVFATCFQRDSVKDQVIVWGFLGLTVGLLAWSFVGGFLGGVVEKVRGRHAYNPVMG